MMNRIVAITDDPDTNFSYGLQMRILIKGLLKKYKFNVISNEYKWGRPHERDGWVKWASEGNARDTRVMPRVISQVKPKLLFTLGDLQHFELVSYRKPTQVPWVCWFPWDNHDPRVLHQMMPIIKSIDVRVVISKFGYDFMTSRGVPIHEQIYNVVDTNTFKPLKKKELDDFYDKNPSLEDKKILLFVGRPNWRKRICHILTIFDKVCQRRDDVVLYLHTNFNDSCATFNFHELVHGLDIYDKVAQTSSEGWMLGASAKFVNKLYNISDLYVAPHGGEGFCLPIAESMACEKTFIATNCTTTPEFAGKNEERGVSVSVASEVSERNVMRPYVNISEFVEKTIDLLDDDSRRRRMGIAGRKWVLENCSKSAVIPKFGKLFDDLNTPRVKVRGVK